MFDEKELEELYDEFLGLDGDAFLDAEVRKLDNEIIGRDADAAATAMMPSNVNNNNFLCGIDALRVDALDLLNRNFVGLDIGDFERKSESPTDLRAAGGTLARTTSSFDKKVDEVDNELKEIDEKVISPSLSLEHNSFHRVGWTPDSLGLWHSGPSSLNLCQPSHKNAPCQDLSSSVTCSSQGAQAFGGFSSSAKRTYSHQQLGAKVEMVYSLLSMLDTDNREDMSKTFLAMSSSPESCHAMRQSGCLPLLIQLIHSSELDKEVRNRAAEALHNIVHAQTDEKRRKREVRVLKLLQQVREYCDELRGDPAAVRGPQEPDNHPINATGTLMKLSFDAEHRQAICILGGLHAITDLIQVDHKYHPSTNSDALCITLRRYAGMSLTNLTFGDGKNKALLCSFTDFLLALTEQLKSPSEDLRQVTASVLRNLSWRADSDSKQALRNVGAVTALTVSAMEAKKESTLKSILSALWNLSAHCSLNKVDICSVPGALAFLVKMLRYKSASNTLSIIENAGGILRNVSSHIAVREDYRQILRDNSCFEVLLEQLRSPSLTIVSNACGTLWNLSARCPEDQRRLWEMGATSMLRSLVQSKHKMISMGSSAALKNLLAANPNGNLLTHLDSTAKSLGLQNLPTLFVRKKRALEQELNITLAETCDNIEPASSSSLPGKTEEGTKGKNADGPKRSESHDSVRSTQSDTIYELINHIAHVSEEKTLDNGNATLHDSLDGKLTNRKIEEQKLMKRYTVSMIPTPTSKKTNQDRINEKTREEKPLADDSNDADVKDSKQRSKKGIPVRKTKPIRTALQDEQNSWSKLRGEQSTESLEEVTAVGAAEEKDSGNRGGHRGEAVSRKKAWEGVESSENEWKSGIDDNYSVTITETEEVGGVSEGARVSGSAAGPLFNDCEEANRKNGNPTSGTHSKENWKPPAGEAGDQSGENDDLDEDSRRESIEPDRKGGSGTFGDLRPLAEKCSRFFTDPRASGDCNSESNGSHGVRPYASSPAGDFYHTDSTKLEPALCPSISTSKPDASGKASAAIFPRFKVGSPITDAGALQMEARKVCGEIQKHRDFEMGCSLNSEISLVSCSSFLDPGDFSLFDSSTDPISLDESEMAKPLSRMKNQSFPRSASQAAEPVSLPSLGSLKGEQIEALDLDNSVLSVASITSEVDENYTKDQLWFNSSANTYKAEGPGEYPEENSCDATLKGDDDSLNAELPEDDNSLHSQENLPLDAECHQGSGSDRMRPRMTPKEKRRNFQDRYRTYTIRDLKGTRMGGVAAMISGEKDKADVEATPEPEVPEARAGLSRVSGIRSEHDIQSSADPHSRGPVQFSKSFDKVRDRVSTEFLFDSRSLNDLLSIGPSERKELFDNAKLVAFSLKTAVDDWETEPVSDSEAEEFPKSSDIDTATYTKAFRNRAQTGLSFQELHSFQAFRDPPPGGETTEKTGAKICKPEDKPQDESLEELSKGIRGRRKLLYSSPQKTSSKIMGISPVVPANAKPAPPRQQSCRSPASLHREGTFTKDDGSGPRKSQGETGTNKSSEVRSPARATGKTKSVPSGESCRGQTRTGRPLSTCGAKGGDKRQKGDPVQRRPFSAGAGSRTACEATATAKKSATTCSVPQKMRNSSSNQNMRAGYSPSKSRNLDSQSGKSQSDASLNLVGSKDKAGKKKEVVSRIAGLWKKVEESKKNKSGKDTRVWIGAERNAAPKEGVVLEREEILHIPTRTIVHSFTCQALTDETRLDPGYEQRNSRDPDVLHGGSREERPDRLPKRGVISAVVTPFNYNPPAPRTGPASFAEVDGFQKNSIKHGQDEVPVFH